MLFANIERAIIRLELSICQWFMFLFKLEGFIDWPWIIVLWPSFISVTYSLVLAWKRTQRKETG